MHLSVQPVGRWFHSVTSMAWDQVQTRRFQRVKTQFNIRIQSSGDEGSVERCLAILEAMAYVARISGYSRRQAEKSLYEFLPGADVSSEVIQWGSQLDGWLLKNIGKHPPTRETLQRLKDALEASPFVANSSRSAFYHKLESFAGLRPRSGSL